MAWLDSGARRAIIAIDISDPSAVQDLASWSSQLPASRHRLVASFRARDLEAAGGGGDGGGRGESLRSAMDRLRPVVGCVQVDFEGDYVSAPQVRTCTVRGALQSIRSTQYTSVVGWLLAGVLNTAAYSGCI